MPTVTRSPGPQEIAVSRSGDEPTAGSPPLGALLPSSDALAPAPDATFAREVELIRCHLAPLRNRRSLTASFGREAFQTLDLDQARPRPLGPIRAAYAIRWLELGTGASLPAWMNLLAVDGR